MITSEHWIVLSTPGPQRTRSVEGVPDGVERPARYATQIVLTQRRDLEDRLTHPNKPGTALVYLCKKP